MESEGAAPYGAETKRAVLRAARELFSRYGYGGTTMAAIADFADVNRPLVYHHFGSKRELFLAAGENAQREFSSMLERDPDLPLEELVVANTGRVFAYWEAHPQVLRTFLGGPTPGIQDVLEEMTEGLIDQILAVHLGSTNVNPAFRLAARCYVGTCKELAREHLVARRISREEAIAAGSTALLGLLEPVAEAVSEV